MHTFNAPGENRSKSDSASCDAAFFALYDQHSSTLYRTICMWVDDKSLSKQLLYKSFLQIHQMYLQHGYEASTFTKMLSITRNVTYTTIQDLDESKDFSCFG